MNAPFLLLLVLMGVSFTLIIAFEDVRMRLCSAVVFLCALLAALS